MASARPDAAVTLTADETVQGAFLVAIDGRAPVRVTPSPHIWAPETYGGVAKALLTANPASLPAGDEDLSARVALADLSVNALLDQNDRVSAALQRDMRSASAQEAAALLVGTFALREAAGMFDDVRPALSRMAAHLAIAGALRGSAPETLDGTFARAILTVLSGLQRDALAIVEAAEPRAVTAADRTWLRALRLRITGDWRQARPGEEAAAVERLEYARAVAWMRGVDAFLDYVDTRPQDVRTDWHRIVFRLGTTIEAGNRYTAIDLDLELAEAAEVRARLRGDALTLETLIPALNDRAAPTPVQVTDGKTSVQVLDWGTWAAFAQRHVCHSLLAHNYHLTNLGRARSQDELIRKFDLAFGELSLYPIVVRSMAQTSGDYDRAMVAARPLARHAPELLTAASWNVLLARPAFTVRDGAFPLDLSWFTPAVPTGTAFDLASRSLRPGCPRPPTKAQAATWAKDRPFDHWTAWAAAYLALDRGAPKLAAVRTAFGSLLEYDEGAVRKTIDYTAMSDSERIAAARTLCDISARQCDILADVLLTMNMNADAASAYERWLAGARDRVHVSNDLTWITRYYLAHGSATRAEAVARMGAETGSARGMQALGEVLERVGRYGEAEEMYREIASAYPGVTSPLGAFLIRQAARSGDAAGQLKGQELLRPVFADGLQAVVMHALPVSPTSGVVPATFGRRASAAGLRRDDIVIGVDNWRVHTSQQYSVAASLSHDETMVLTVWRQGRYQRLRLRVPERWFGIQWGDYSPGGTARR